MPEVVPEGRPRDRTAVTEQLARIVEQPRPQWEGLFLEPDLPPRDEEDA
jgi:hypothetical protein